ncbi:MAG: DUF2807 domain-containing protein [Rhodospirillaceae bacterium]
MKHRGLIITAVVVGGIIFIANRPQAEDRKSSWTPIFFNSGECDGASADVSGSKARLAWDGSDHVTIAVPAKSRWRRGEGTDVVLHGDADDLERIRLEKGTLKVCGDIDNEVEIVLPGRMFEKVTIAGAGELSMKDVDQASLELTIAGAGKIDADGASESLKVTIAGAGETNLGKLETKRLKLTITGAGEAQASPEDDADITVIGSGNVDLLKRPKHHDFDVIGAGDIDMPDRT